MLCSNGVPKRKVGAFGGAKSPYDLSGGDLSPLFVYAIIGAII
jgi:hypothetical protein